jgi:hypothetical protein
MLYECKRCEYESTYISHLKKHLSRIKECEDIKKCGISSACLLQELDIDKTEFEHKCSFCDEQFQSTSGKYKHEVKCKIINENIKLKDENIKLKDENIKLKEQLKEQEKDIEIKVLKNMLQNQQPTSSTSLINQPIQTIQNNQPIQNQTIQNQTIDNTHNETNIYNNITINAIGYENTSYITDEFAINCIKNCVPGVWDFIKEVSFNKDHPENHNIRNIDDTNYEILSNYKIKNIPWGFVNDYKKVEMYKSNMVHTITKKTALNQHILNIPAYFFKSFMEKTDIKNKIGKKNIIKFVETVVGPLGWGLNLPEEDDIEINVFSEEFDEKQNELYNMFIQFINQIGTHKKFIDI